MMSHSNYWCNFAELSISCFFTAKMNDAASNDSMAAMHLWPSDPSSCHWNLQTCMRYIPSLIFLIDSKLKRVLYPVTSALWPIELSVCDRQSLSSLSTHIIDFIFFSEVECGSPGRFTWAPECSDKGGLFQDLLATAITNYFIWGWSHLHCWCSGKHLQKPICGIALWQTSHCRCMQCRLVGISLTSIAARDSVGFMQVWTAVTWNGFWMRHLYKMNLMVHLF